MVNGSQAKKIILFLRHGQAYENLAPGGNNKLCNFTLHGAMVQNWDSALTKTGLDQAAAVHSFLLSKAVNQSEQETWYEVLRLKSAAGFSSPLTRTLETAREALLDPATSASFMRPLTSASLLRASLGENVCNGRHL